MASLRTPRSALHHMRPHSYDALTLPHLTVNNSVTKESVKQKLPPRAPAVWAGGRVWDGRVAFPVLLCRRCVSVRVCVKSLPKLSQTERSAFSGVCNLNESAFKQTGSKTARDYMYRARPCSCASVRSHFQESSLIDTILVLVGACARMIKWG